MLAAGHEFGVDRSSGVSGKFVRAAQYVRMSTEHQKYSTENQAEAMQQYAARRGIEIVRTYADEGKSGLRLDGLDALTKLFPDVKIKGADFTTILVYDISRWGRFQDADESAYYEYLCKGAEISVQYCAEQFENDGSIASTIVKGMKRAMAGECGHPSIERNVRQLPMPFMGRNELEQIFKKRLPDLGMTFDADTQDTLIRLAQGLPGNTHLLGQNAARNAIKRRSLHIEVQDLNAALHKSIEACDEKIKNLYAVAVRSTKPGNQYRQALLACALAPIDERGYFPAKNVKDPFSRIMGRPMEIPHFARHLAEFCNDERGPALLKEGKPKSYMFRFSNALLRPFVVIKGITDELISGEIVK